MTADKAVAEMTDEEFMALFDALTEQNKVLLLDLMDKLLTEQLGEQAETA